MSMAWIEYRKAFDSVPHDRIMKSVKLFKVSPIIVYYLKSNILNWEITLFLSHESGNLKSKRVGINRGIFQEDSLPPLLLCLALIPFNTELNRTGYGCKIGQKNLDHHELEGLLQTVKKFSDGMDMKFELEKCAKAKNQHRQN